MAYKTFHVNILGSPSKSKKKKGGVVPAKALDMALHQIKGYLNFRNHDDLDTHENVRNNNVVSPDILFVYFSIINN